MAVGHRRLRACLMLVSACVFSLTVFQALDLGMHQTIPQPIGRHSASLGIAISDLMYGLRGYVGFARVHDGLIQDGLKNVPDNLRRRNKTLSELLTHGPTLQRALDRSTQLEIRDTDQTYILAREDVGLVTFYKYALAIFGVRLSSFLFLYVSILAVSLVAFSLAFRRRTELLHLLVLFVCAHYATVTSAHDVGIQLQTVHNSRFLSVLAILPALHLAVLVVGRSRPTLFHISAAAIQVGILMLAIHARNSASSYVFAVALVALLALAWHQCKAPSLGSHVFSTIAIWPVVLLLGGYGLLRLHQVTGTDPSYSSATSRHLFWDPIYKGLGTSEFLRREYGIEWGRDSAVFEKARSIARARGEEGVISYERHEEIIRSEYLRILSESPMAVIANYLSKPLHFVSAYAVRPFNGIRNALSMILAVAVAVGGILAGGRILWRWRSSLSIMVALLGFSFLPNVLFVPAPHVISEPSLITTMLLYLIPTLGAVILVERRRAGLHSSIVGNEDVAPRYGA